MVRICIAMPPEKASRKRPKPAMRQSRSHVRSSVPKATTKPMAMASDSTRAARVAAVQASLNAAASATDGNCVSASTFNRPTACNSAQPFGQQHDRQIAGMVEIFLRQAGIEQEAVIDDPEIHVGDAPIRIPEAGDQKRSEHAAADEQQLRFPRKRNQALDRRGSGVAGGSRPELRSRGAEGLHVGGLREMVLTAYYTSGARQQCTRGRSRRGTSRCVRSCAPMTPCWCRRSTRCSKPRISITWCSTRT